MANKLKGVLFYAKSFKDIRKNRLVVEEMEFKSKLGIFCYLKTKKVIGEGSKPIMHPLEVDLFDLEIGEKGN